jgi:predicted secreted acid phosphatase
MEAITRLGIGVPREQVLCATTTSDKTARRKEVTDQANVLLLIGDNLRDFSEDYRHAANSKSSLGEMQAANQKRKDQVDKDAALWGSKWIILPNPAYGEWNKVLGTANDLKLLR